MPPTAPAPREALGIVLPACPWGTGDLLPPLTLAHPGDSGSFLAALPPLVFLFYFQDSVSPAAFCCRSPFYSFKAHRVSPLKCFIFCLFVCLNSALPSFWGTSSDFISQIQKESCSGAIQNGLQNPLCQDESEYNDKTAHAHRGASQKEKTEYLESDKWQKVLKMTPETQIPPPPFPASYCVMNLWRGQGAHKAPSVPLMKGTEARNKRGAPDKRRGVERGMEIHWTFLDPPRRARGMKTLPSPQALDSGNFPSQGTEFKNASDQGLHGGTPHTLWKGQIWEQKFGNKTQEPQKCLDTLTQ